MDHCSDFDAGVQYILSGNTTALVTRDVYSIVGYACPSNTKNTDSVITAMLRFAGADLVSSIYPDKVDELIAAARYLRIPSEASQLGIQQTNGIIEREVPDMLTGARTYGHTALSRRCGAELQGQLTPFGAGVILEPSPTT